MTTKNSNDYYRFYSNKNADDVCMAIRSKGGSAWVERDSEGRDFVVTNLSVKGVELAVAGQLWLRNER